MPVIAGALWLFPNPSSEVENAVPTNSSQAEALADAAPTTSVSDGPSLAELASAALGAGSAGSGPAGPGSATTVVVSPDTGPAPEALASEAQGSPEAQTSSQVQGNSALGSGEFDATAPVGEPTPADTTTTASTTSTTSEPTTSTAVATTTTSAVPPSIGDQALSRVGYPWRSTFPEWEVVFRGPRSGIRALTYPEDRRVEIFIRPSDTVSSLHRVFAHELGHVIDVELNSSSDRDRWLAQRGIPDSAPWWPSAESPDFATGAGDFAEAFAVWETGVTTRSTIGTQPTADDLALLRELSQG